ncbi:perlucin-like protein [Ostrea edulis]|uniref:perlucin-like protein n=1 Tax=Ostrea edulis TaxID=37623 RepID=UPI002095A7D7|nr:perlucin-like protein [Ostrea edulis]XP_056015319.1 perlucin-like protein [Ostrea edulis]
MASFVSSLLAALVILVVVDSKCPLDWVQIETNCIQFNKNQHTWTDSANFCRNIGAHLVTVDSEAKDNFIKQFLNAFASSKLLPSHWWIGGSDFAVEGTWQWLTGGSVGSYSGWGPGQPDGNNTANCMSYRFFNRTTIGWSDDLCAPHTHHGHHSHLPGYICEKPLSAFASASVVVG